MKQISVLSVQKWLEQLLYIIEANNLVEQKQFDKLRKYVSLFDKHKHTNIITHTISKSALLKWLDMVVYKQPSNIKKLSPVMAGYIRALLYLATVCNFDRSWQQYSIFIEMPCEL